MKKLTFLVLGLVAGFMASAQMFVSTEPANRNVVIEEFTGRNCGYCPDGHVIANSICNNNPGRAWAVNIHAGSFAPTSYPNFNTTVSEQICAGYGVTSFPAGLVNRSTAQSINRGQWSGTASQQLAQASELNVGGQVVINPETREASITVEVYYTGNSTETTNYLTVYMLQDSIWGSQSGGASNPSQWVGGQYCHMHILRDAINESLWGDPITPTTAGTFITKEYTYAIPEMIGSPNGVEVDIENIHFLAFVCARTTNNPARNILSANMLEKSEGSDEPIYPVIKSVSQRAMAVCSQVKTFDFSLVNGGTENLTSIQYKVEVGNAVEEYEWTGNLEPRIKEDVSFEMEIPFGTNAGKLTIVKANGQDYPYEVNFTAVCNEWVETEPIEGETTTMKIYINQDQFGEQTTWDLVNSLGEVIAEGGPYAHLISSGSTQLHVETIEDIPTGADYLFNIYDNNENGICCTYGEGWYKIKVNDVYIIGQDQDNGDFGAHGSELMRINRGEDLVGENGLNGMKVYPNPANSTIFVEGENIKTVEIYNSLGQMVANVEGSAKTSVNVASFDNGVYFVKVVADDGAVKTQKVTIAR
ncbi:MAG: Omp28-related outer membrane protein [Bacteroidales bacterium]|nr:Omp28-related outer membrane protein [Bacteroidales bacterium]